MLASRLVALLGVVAASPSKPSHSTPFAGLLESAKGLLIHGASDETVLQAEVNEMRDLMDKVSAILKRQAEEDQDFLQKSWLNFHDIIKEFNDSFQEGGKISDGQKDVVTLESDHKQLRGNQSEACRSLRLCLGDAYHLTCQEIVARTEHHDNEQQLDQYICVENITDFNTQGSVIESVLPKFNKTYEDVVNAKNKTDEKIIQCNGHYTELDEKSSQANEKQRDLEERTCQLTAGIIAVQNAFNSSWKEQHELFQANTEMVHNQTLDRNSEFQNLEMLGCLVGKLELLNYLPCDTTADAEGNITDCEDNWTKTNDTLCETHSYLCMTYPSPPEEPKGPSAPPVPCSADWNSTIMSPLPKVPTAPFSHDNPGCNAYPACSDCASYSIEIPEYESGDYHRWEKPLDEFAGNVSQAKKYASDQNYTGFPGGVNYPDKANDVEAFIK